MEAKTRLKANLAAAALFSLALCEDLQAGTPQAVTSTTLLTSGVSRGVGGGPQQGFGLLNVCDAQKITDDAIVVATAKALDDLGLSLDPPTTDPLSTLTIGAEWRTSPSTLSGDVVDGYNEASQFQLNKAYRYYVSYQGRLGLKGRSLVLQTVTALFTGSNSQESQPFTGDFDPRYFHTILQKKILEEIQNYGCS
ncbi:hypothetical protein [Mesorhizobium sp. BH1-1-4]|uniref:hypothetical protein n=1 Tax=Mesorhizobium sp. BH1-1-4 TaxID=2876662 RepID=UPI001CD17D15|nr:hypothetical protein [Mesorhizobium sp. BH1-1-4]MBZ9994035.1 hypothetical protein [Mesorhizobium sp. BH1-1-4]